MHQNLLTWYRPPCSCTHSANWLPDQPSRDCSTAPRAACRTAGLFECSRSPAKAPGAPLSHTSSTTTYHKRAMVVIVRGLLQMHLPEAAKARKEYSGYTGVHNHCSVLHAIHGNWPECVAAYACIPAKITCTDVGVLCMHATSHL
jgi:hypothetical protein